LRSEILGWRLTAVCALHEQSNTLSEAL
jgi:hypothetical protein